MAKFERQGIADNHLGRIGSQGSVFAAHSTYQHPSAMVRIPHGQDSAVLSNYGQEQTNDPVSKPSPLQRIVRRRVVGHIRSASRFSLLEKITQYRTMTLRFVVTIASDREIGLMRKRRQQVQVSGWCGRFHFG